ncbi:DNA-binding transcriptional MocR family regulator [Leucobacter exalbidus]|uniref:DNA-binding transcriptional MocR family regulator n=1 Tax=Leucobacter exalbidus TaxID=662960 RepID=A0A940PQK3_9MICO|nr:PLP-dependent aminotransferase family protein [Leucobacter exalbidus]MBP1327503.1 DNA-binding transcriptional MocR family regulator [Leucobacter exalbidus]
MIAQRITAHRLRQLLGEWRGDGHSYRELADSIELLTRDGAVAPGSALPAERRLAEELGVSRTTVAAAYQRLRDGAIAVSRQGSGTVVRVPRTVEIAHDEGIGAGAFDLTQATPAPWQGLASLGQRAFEERPDAFELPGYDTIGASELRRTIAERYSARGLPTSPEQIMVTLGAQHAIFLVARTLLARGDRALIEAPSYPHARGALAATGALIAELPVEVSQRDPAAALEIAARVSPRLAYLIPDHHNPTGSSMPAELRGELIATLTARGSHILVDETTAELTLGELRTVLPFAAAAEHPYQQDAIITVGSLGKTVWGGLRIGWIRAAPELIDRLEVARRLGDLGTGVWEQVIATYALESYDEILADRCRELTPRHRLLISRLAAELPGWRPSAVVGGACTWVDLGEHRSTALAREATQVGVRLTPGPRFGSPGVFERFIRIPFTLPLEQIPEVVTRLASAWQVRGGPPAPPLREGAVL